MTSVPPESIISGVDYAVRAVNGRPLLQALPARPPFRRRGRQGLPGEDSTWRLANEGSDVAGQTARAGR